MKVSGQKSRSNLSSIIDWERVRMFLPPAAFDFLHTSQRQKIAGTPSAAAVPRYFIFISCPPC
jgi:hypothetical protein